MGWGNFLANLGMDYLSERGISGAMEDANNLKNGVQKLFGAGGSSDDEAPSAYQEEWNQTIDEVNRRSDNEDYQGAVNVLESFYTNNNEEYDFWYAYWRTVITYRQWYGKALDEACDDNTVKYSSQCDILYSNVRQWLSRTQESASEEGEIEKYREISHQVMSDKDDFDGFLKDNKAWLEINAKINPQATQNGPQWSKFNDAINKVKTLYHYDKSVYFYNAGLVRVYTFLLEAATHNATLLGEIRPKFQQIQNEIRQASNGMKKTVGDNQDSINAAAEAINHISELLAQVDAIMSNKSSVHVQESKPAQKSNAGSSANEQEYLEEVKACFADDGEISQRERRLLNRLRESLGISEQRAKELEASLSPSLTDDEKEYVAALKESLVDGTISNRERRLLDKLRVSMGISEQRAKELEKSLS